MKKNILITGGFGYLGGRIAEKLASEGQWNVQIGSRQYRDKPEWLPDGETVVFDLMEPDTLETALMGVHAVVHLAAMNEIECAANPVNALQVNTLGTLNLVDASIKAGVERFVYFSTAHIYGAPLSGHITEHSLPRPIHPYAITHHAAEDFVLSAHDKGDFTGVVARLSNGFGVPTHPKIDRWTLLVNNLCLQAVQSKKLTLRSHGNQYRDFITLHDVGRVVNHFLGLSRKECADGVFNVGGACSMTVWEMTQKIADCCDKMLGFRPEFIRPEDGGGNEIDILDYDISKLKNTGFSIEGDIDREIIDTLKICASVQDGLLS